MSTKKGLEGIVATESSVSSIIDDQLTYVGYKIDDLTDKASFEEVIYLLWHLKLPNKAELETLRSELSDNMALPEEIISHLKSYDLSTVHPMAALRTAISMLGLYDDERSEERRVGKECSCVRGSSQGANEEERESHNRVQ